MKKLGAWLRQTREAHGCTLEEAEDTTRIRAHFLEMLEAGDFAALPGGEVQARGFLRVYARFLELSPEKVVAHYNAEVHGVDIPDSEISSIAEQEPPSDLYTYDNDLKPFQPRDIPITSSIPRWMSLETLLIVGIVLVTMLIVMAVTSYVMGARDEDAGLAAATATQAESTAPAPTETVPRLTPTPTFPVNPDGTVTVSLRAVEHVWVRVIRDNQTVLEEMMTEDQEESWTGQESIIVQVGNGAGVEVTVNGQPQGTMCGRGEACRRTWGPNGEITTP